VGAALVPFAVGVLAQTRGIGMVMPLYVALEICMVGIWIMVPTKVKG